MKENQTDGAATATPPRPVPVIYVRSAVDGEGQLQERVEDARELARLHALDVAQDDTIAEHGSGADIHRRPGIQRILRMAARGEVSHLVTLTTSHLSRDYHELRQVLISLTEAGVKVVTGYNSDLSFANDAFSAALASRR